MNDAEKKYLDRSEMDLARAENEVNRATKT
jgi:hypothetical protein